MKSGRLDERIELFKPAAAVDDGYTSAPGGVFNSEGEWFAQYMPGRVSEVFEALGREGILPAVFLVRRNTTTETVDETWKLLHRGITYDVLGAVRYERDGIRITATGSDEPTPDS